MRLQPTVVPETRGIHAPASSCASTRKDAIRWPSGMYSCSTMRLKVTGDEKDSVTSGAGSPSRAAQ